jgi:4-alpha-glucanotransferase
MTSGPSVAALKRLAQRRGVLSRYRDGFRQQRTASVETLLAVVRELGAPIESVSDAPDALGQDDLSRWQTPAPPVTVCWGGKGVRFPLRVPADHSASTLRWELTLESGEVQSGELLLSSIRTCADVKLGNVRFFAKDFTLPLALPVGRHRLRIESGILNADTLVLSAPSQCWQTDAIDRSWGAFLPLYALHSADSWGAGSFTDLGRLFDWVKGQGGRFVGTLPLLAAYLDEPFEYSPYVPASRLFWNEFYVDPQATPEWQQSTRARELLACAEASGELARFRSDPMVDYREQAALRQAVLSELSAVAFSSADRCSELEAFATSTPHLNDYAQFRTTVDKRAPAKEVRNQHVYAQWAADAQLTALAERAGQPGLYLDLPLGVHPQSYDVWRNASCYAGGSNGGAPPDRFFTQGQNWGFAPLHPERIRQDGYQHLTDIIRNHLRYGGILRVDHFMWLHRLYWIPQGAAASEGTYVQYPADELYAILAIESHRSQSLVVGEDLGTVPAYVRNRMSERAIDRMYVAQFSFQTDRQQPLKAPPAETLASVNTHDTPTWASFWSGADVTDQVSMGLLTAEEAGEAQESRANLRKTLVEAYGCEESAAGALPEILERLAKSDSRAVLVNLEDLWCETNPQNTPGTGPERPNWRRRAKLSLEQMQTDATVLEMLSLVDRNRREHP